MDYVALVIVLAILEYFFFMGMVGKARGDYSVKAPATTGDEMFERYYRVHQNTLEQLVMFIPSIYCFGVYMHALGAAALGLLFLIGRMVYFKAYIADPDSRGVGMMIGFMSIMILMLGALVGIIIELI
ncbi:MAG: MAPEG family protein [Gammaproteobacteria bacterium]|nr:MAPEG family protein [Gammaproteobacteria bacterium]